MSTFAAVAAHSRGIWHESTDELQTATALLATGPRPLAHASALEDLGRQLIQCGNNNAGIEALEEGLTITTRVGANWDATRIRSRLRRMGIRRRPASTARPKTGWAALTNVESAVARLAAESNTNSEIAEKLFISPHTVNTHLRHIFEKLDINSRVTLTRIAGQRERSHTGNN